MKTIASIFFFLVVSPTFSEDKADDPEAAFTNAYMLCLKAERLETGNYADVGQAHQEAHKLRKLIREKHPDWKLKSQKAARLETSSSTADAVRTYQEADKLLKLIREKYPDWKKPIVEYRARRVALALERLAPQPESKRSE